MKKILILIPVFNDWKSLEKLLIEINQNIKDFKEISFECLIVNDASTIPQPKFIKPKNLNKIKILTMKKNQGHARCNAFGIKYVNDNEKFDYLILMDADGEDRPLEIKSMINQISSEPKCSVVAKRVKRSEGPFFQLLYKIHKIITYVSSGKNVNFGNYSCLTHQDVKILYSKASLWSSYSGTIKKNLKNLKEVNSERGLRYYGPSQMSFLKLLIHSLSIIAVFKYKLFFRSLLMSFILIIFDSYLKINSKSLIFLILLYNFLIFIVSLRENEKEFNNCQSNLLTTQVLQ